MLQSISGVGGRLGGDTTRCDQACVESSAEGRLVTRRQRTQKAVWRVKHILKASVIFIIRIISTKRALHIPAVHFTARFSSFLLKPVALELISRRQDIVSRFLPLL
jgi:hypothetical protein